MTQNHTLKHKENGFTLIPNILNKHQLEPIRVYSLMKLAKTPTREVLIRLHHTIIGHRSDQGVLYDLFQRHPKLRALASSKAILKGTEDKIDTRSLLVFLK